MMQSIKAKMIEKIVMWTELPIDSANCNSRIEKYLLDKGYKFNKEKGHFECVYHDDEKAKDYLLTWHMKSTLNKTIIHTFQGEIFPFEQDMRSLMKPHIFKRYYTLEGDWSDTVEIIRELLKRKFEVVYLTKDGEVMQFEWKSNQVTLFHKADDKFKLSFKGFKNMSRSLLAAFSIG
jgi:hypothetical protein